MKFQCNRQALLDVVAMAAQVVKLGQRVASLNGLRVQLEGSTLTITGSDLELTVRAQMQVEGTTDGETIIPAKLLSDISRQIASDTITVDYDAEGDATISGGRTEYALRTYAAGEYPKLAEAAGDQVQVDAGALRVGIERVVKAAGTDTARPSLTGVLFEAHDDVLRLVATDSYRLAMCDIDGVAMLAGHAQAIVPAAGLQQLLPLLSGDATVGVCFDFQQQVVAFEVTSDDRKVQLTARLIEGNYPAYQGLLPESYPNVAEIDRDEFAKATRRVSLVGRDNKTPVRISQSSAGLELNVIAQDQGRANEAVDATYTGDELVVAFNPDYLQDGIDATASTRLRLETENSSKPAILRPIPDDDSDGPAAFLYLLMPVRIS